MTGKEQPFPVAERSRSVWNAVNRAFPKDNTAVDTLTNAHLVRVRLLLHRFWPSLMALDQNALNSLRIERNTSTYGTPGGKRRRWVVLLVVIVLLLVALAGWKLRSTPIEVATGAVTTVRTGAAPVLDASGYVVARRQATVSAKVTGKVAEVQIEEGMKVKAGQVLATLDTSTTQRQLDLAQQQLQAAQADLKQVQVQLGEAERSAKRAEQLRANKMISEADLDTAQSNAAALRAQLDALQSQVSVANANLRVQQQAMDDLIVRAPFSGVVISKDAQPGEIVSPLSAGSGYTRTGIATIVDMDSREIEVDVNEAFIHRVTDDQKATAILDAYPDWTIACHVISIVPTADRQKATVKVRIGFDQLDPRILPDMGVKVSFLDDTKPADSTAPRAMLEAPSSAIVTRDGKQYVWRIHDDQVALIAVSTGDNHSDRTEIVSGLTAGDTVVINPPDTLKEGSKVVVK
jgi:RND family efflux transporter MFP subunit